MTQVQGSVKTLEKNFTPTCDLRTKKFSSLVKFKFCDEFVDVLLYYLFQLKV